MIAAELHPPPKAVNLLCNHHNQVLSSKHQKTSVIEVKQRLMFMLFTTLHELINVEDIQSMTSLIDKMEIHMNCQMMTAYFIMKMNFYNEMAVRIQKRWRGYYVRKYIHNYYGLKKYLETVSMNNEFVRNKLRQYTEMKENEEKKKDLEKKEKEKQYQARKMHYLLSTEQGPFRDTAEVLRQRYKPLEPTLRVAASINSPLEKAREEMKMGEWRNRVHDNEFLPFSSYHKNEKYDPSICRSGKYGQETYGIKHFREVQPKKWIAGK
ncbi:Spata17, partial [Columba guinea]